MIDLLFVSFASLSGLAPALLVPFAPAAPQSAAASPTGASPAATAGSAAAADPAFDAKLAAAGKDVPKLLELAAACTTGGQDDAAKRVYAKVIEVDPANEAAHKALRHQPYDGKWFESFAELSKYKREEAAKMKAKGLARYKDSWVPEADVPFLNMGWTKDEAGTWVNPVEVARAAKIAELQAAGYEFRADDNSWIAPEDKANWEGLLWKCGDEWVETKVANAYHAQIGRWWQLVGEHFTVWTTCDWEGGNWARWFADQTWPDLVRIFGVEPGNLPHFIVLNSIAQYNQASGANPPLIPESEGSSSVYGAYFADAYLDTTSKPPQFLGAGVSFWDRNDAKLKAWGPYFLRWAAAQSYVDAIDPSWNTIGTLVSGGDQADPNAVANAFWREKKIPRWLRYGAASYAERFMRNPETAQGADPWDMRAFAFGELKKAGGLGKLDDVFAFNVDLKNADKAAHLYHQAGLVVAYLLDGAEGDEELAGKHEAFKNALKGGSKADVTAAMDGLQQALAKHDADIRTFAGL